MITVYVLRSKEGKVYVGMTKNIGSRLQLHNADKIRSTKGSDWQLIYSAEFKDYYTARIREKYFKSNAGKEWLQRRNIL